MENYMKLEFSALPENEAFARTVAAAFVMPLDPTVEELTEIKTAVSEAVSNCIIHAYGDAFGGGENSGKGESAGVSGSTPKCAETRRVVLECALDKKGKLTVKVEDQGVGIENVKQAMEPLFTTGDEEERSGMGFTVMESFMDKLMVISERGKGTTVIMTKQLDVFSGI